MCVSSVTFTFSAKALVLSDLFVLPSIARSRFWMASPCALMISLKLLKVSRTISCTGCHSLDPSSIY